MPAKSVSESKSEKNLWIQIRIQIKLFGSATLTENTPRSDRIRNYFIFKMLISNPAKHEGSYVFGP
jgi:hypothetical protein